MKVKPALILVMLLSFSGCMSVPNPELMLENTLDKAIAGGIIGLSCFVSTQSGSFFKTAGLVGLNDSRVTPESLFRIASQSKIFYGIAASVLIAEGKIDEDAPISRYIPADITEGLTNGNIITVHELLHHSSGLFDYLNGSDDFLEAVYENLTRVWTKEEVLGFAYNKPASNEPGEGYHYSNTNYLLLAMIIERVTQEDCAAVIRRLILDPLHLGNTYVDSLEPYDRNLLVHGYFQDVDAGPVDLRDIGADMPGDGGIVSTPADVFNLLEKVLVNSDFPSAEHRQAFLDAFLPHEAANSLSEIDRNSYGAGIMGARLNGEGSELCYTHGGSLPGYHSDLYYFPESGKGFCVIFNNIENSEASETTMQTIMELYKSLFTLMAF